MNILVLMGPGMKSLNADGQAGLNAAQLEVRLQKEAMALGANLEVVQSNHEGALIDCLENRHVTFGGFLIFPAALAKSGWALREEIRLLGLKAVEVHFDAAMARGSVLKPVCVSQEMGVQGAVKGLKALVSAGTEKKALLGARKKTSAASAAPAAVPKTLGRKGKPIAAPSAGSAAKPAGTIVSANGKTLGRRR